MNHKYRRARSSQGQAIAEGAVALILIVTGVVAGIVFLLDAGASIYWKDKLTFVTNQAASFAAQKGERVQQSEVEDFVKTLLPACGININNVEVKTETIDAGGKKLCKVTLTNTFPLFVTGVTFLPFEVRLTDQAAAIAGSGGAGTPPTGGSAFLYFVGKLGDRANGAPGGDYARFKVPVVETATTSVGGNIAPNSVSIPDGASYYWDRGRATDTPADMGARFILPGQ